MFLSMLLLNYADTSQLMINLSIGFISFLFIAYVLPTIKRILYLPSGPWGLPIVGYLPFITKNNEYSDLDHLAKKYGPIYSLRLGNENVIVVSCWTHAKEVFTNDALLGHPKYFDDNSFGDLFIEMSGESWRAHHELSLQLLRDVGLGKSAFEEKIKSEIEQFLPKLEKVPVQNLFRTLLSTISNNLSFLLIGHDFDDSDPFKESLMDILITLSKVSSQFSIFTVFPLKNFWSQLKKTEVNPMMETLNSFSCFLQKEIEEHKKKIRSSNFDNYIDGYLLSQSRREESDNGELDIKLLRQNLIGLYGIGSETVASTLSWAILYLIKHPDYYDKIRDEISNVIGFERSPSYFDRVQMPVTMAFVCEVHRCSTIFPANPFRRATRDTKIGNYNVPKDTCVIINFWAIHHDPLLWLNPDEFDPSQFLAEHGVKAVKPPFLLPFSRGIRTCPGEGLANVEVFLYLVSIVQKYRIEVEPESEITLEPEFGTIRRPKKIPPLIFKKVI